MSQDDSLPHLCQNLRMTPQQTLGSDFASYVTAGVRLMGFFGLIAVLMPVHIVYGICKPQEPFRIAQLFHRVFLRLLGFRVRVHGIMAATPPVLFVANHASYLDIPVLGAL